LVEEPSIKDGPMNFPDNPIATIVENVVYENTFVRVYDNPVRFPDGSAGRYLRIIESAGRPGVAALAVADARIALVHTYRYPTQSWEWGIPRGFANTDDPYRSVRQELREEIAAAPTHLEPLVTVHSNSGLLAGQVHIYLARYAKPTTAPLDIREIAAIRWVTLDELLKEINNRPVNDAFTVAAVGAAYAKGVFPI
jgi:ADP-ribose pyrophosphatase YjhB (NUDIX family)